MKGVFVTATDTEVGKTITSCALALTLANTRVIKPIQTGCLAREEGMYVPDVEMVKSLGGRAEALHCFYPPCSPHLAAEIDGREIDFEKIESATRILSERYDAVLLEGAGGLMVPLTGSLLTIDYVREKGYPLIFVTSGRLGSISHTLLALEAVKSRRIRLEALVFNMFPEEEDGTIAENTKEYLRARLAKEFPEAGYLSLPVLEL